MKNLFQCTLKESIQVKIQIHNYFDEISYSLLESTDKKNSFPVISIDFADVNKMKMEYITNKAQARNKAIILSFILRFRFILIILRKQF